MPIADAAYGAHSRTATAPNGDSFVVLHSGAIPEAVEGVSNNPEAQPVPTVSRSFFTPPARPALRELTYYTRPMAWRAKWYNGQHGTVRRRPVAMVGPQQTPFLRPPRTLRAAPVAPWDAGTALSPTGRATGAEE